MGWLVHSACFLYQGHKLLSQLKQLKMAPSKEGWEVFLWDLQHSFVKNVFSIAKGSQGFTILMDVSKQGWGVVLLEGSRVLRCALGL